MAAKQLRWRRVPRLLISPGSHEISLDAEVRWFAAAARLHVGGGSDPGQGKLTLPLVLAVQAHPELLEQLRRIRAGDQSAVSVLRQSVIASGACQKVSARALTYTTRAIGHLDVLPSSPARSLLRAGAQQLADRSR